MKRSGFQVQSATVVALLIRELKTRFGPYRLGYAWAVLEPAFHIGLMLVLFGVVMGRAMPDISYPVFLVNGVVPWLMFNSIATQSLNAIEANSGLFNYRPVKPIDTLVARGVLEGMTYLQVYIVLCLLNFLLGESGFPDDIAGLIVVLLLLWMLAMGFGLLLMVVGDVSKEAGRVIAMALKPLYFLSGIMFSLHTVPPEFHKYVLWNPVIHAVELIRHAFLLHYQISHVSLAYLAITTLLIVWLGLALYKYREEAMLTT